jgi:hypothetical protein
VQGPPRDHIMTKPRSRYRQLQACARTSMSPGVYSPCAGIGCCKSASGCSYHMQSSTLQHEGCYKVVKASTRLRMCSIPTYKCSRFPTFTKPTSFSEGLKLLSNSRIGSCIMVPAMYARASRNPVAVDKQACNKVSRWQQVRLWNMTMPVWHTRQASVTLHTRACDTHQGIDSAAVLDEERAQMRSHAEC